LGNPRTGAGNPSYDPSQRIAPPVDAMALYGLRGSNKRKYVATTDANHGLPVAPNLLACNFTAVDGRHHLHGDNRRLAFQKGTSFLTYLVVAIDLFSRQMMSWSMHSHMRA
jgi:putative transposase